MHVPDGHCINSKERKDDDNFGHVQRKFKILYPQSCHKSFLHNKSNSMLALNQPSLEDAYFNHTFLRDGEFVPQQKQSLMKSTL